MATTLDDLWFDEQAEKDEAEQARIASAKSSVPAKDTEEDEDEDDDEGSSSDWDDDEDDEERIMRSLDSGDGDLHGY